MSGIDWFLYLLVVACGGVGLAYGVRTRAMVLAGDTIVLAGPPELLALSDGTVGRQDLDAAQMAYDGEGGAMLPAVPRGIAKTGIFLTCHINDS